MKLSIDQELKRDFSRLAMIIFLTLVVGFLLTIMFVWLK